MLGWMFAALTAGAFVATAIARPTLASPLQQSQRPTSFEVVDHFRTPATLQALWDASPLVVRVTLGAGELRPVHRGGGTPEIVREHGATILEVIKNQLGTADLAVGRAIRVGQPGGTMEVDDVEVTTVNAGGATWKETREYVLFLQPWHSGTYTVVFGGIGSYELTEDEVKVPGRARTISGLTRSSIPRNEFLNLIRSLRRDG